MARMLEKAHHLVTCEKLKRARELSLVYWLSFVGKHFMDLKRSQTRWKLGNENTLITSVKLTKNLRPSLSFIYTLFLYSQAVY